MTVSSISQKKESTMSTLLRDELTHCEKQNAELRKNLQAAQSEVKRLRAALEKYRHCRHADLLCNCAADAVAALEHKP